MALLETNIPTEAERTMAANASQLLAKGEIELAKLPPSAVKLLAVALTEIKEGRSLTLKPVKSEMTTFEAADYLDVSRPYLIKLLNEGQMPYRRVGKHRRIALEQLRKYRDQSDENS